MKTDCDLAEFSSITDLSRLRGAAARTRICMASEQDQELDEQREKFRLLTSIDEQEEQVSGEWRRTRYVTSNRCKATP